MALLPIKDDNPLTNIPFQFVTVGLIALNIAAFIWQLSLGDSESRIVLGVAAIPSVLVGAKTLPPELALVPAWLTLITGTFLHGGWLHLGGNMLFLWIFGDNIEDAMGHLRYLAFYVICGVIASLAHVLFNAASDVPLIGASGAISGVLGAYLVLHPKARVLVLFMNIIPMRLPAFIVLSMWIGLQFLNLQGSGGAAGSGGTAWWAHIGGFAAGIALVFLFRRKPVPLFDGVGRFRPTEEDAAFEEERRTRRSILPNTYRGRD